MEAREAWERGQDANARRLAGQAREWLTAQRGLTRGQAAEADRWAGQAAAWLASNDAVTPLHDAGPVRGGPKLPF